MANPTELGRSMATEAMDRAIDLDAEARAVSDEVDGLFRRLLALPGDGRDRLYSAMAHAAIA